MYERIVCLTEETTETLYLLGAEERIVGISGFTVRPPRARKEKPKVSAFLTAKIDRILDLEPDLVLGFSDLQADIAQDLIRRGIEVMVFNQRSVAGILRMIRTVSAMVDRVDAGRALADRLESGLMDIERAAAALDRRPRVYFEEWYDPLISGIGWVSELVRVAGGDDCFPELARESLARGRIIEDPLEVVRRDPELIIGSWCGRRFRPEKLMARPGWESVAAVKTGQVHEVKSALILQPGPAALTDGVAAIHGLVREWASQTAGESEA